MSTTRTLIIAASLALALAGCDQQPQKPQRNGAGNGGSGTPAPVSSEPTADDIMATFHAALKEADTLALVSMIDEASPAYEEMVQYTQNIEKVKGDPKTTPAQLEFFESSLRMVFDKMFGTSEYQKIGEENGVARYTLSRPATEAVSVDVMKKGDQWVVAPKSKLLTSEKPVKSSGPQVPDMGGRDSMPPKKTGETPAGEAPSGEAPAPGGEAPAPEGGAPESGEGEGGSGGEKPGSAR